MHSTFISLTLLATLTGQALAGVFITSPTATSTGTGGQSFSVVWQEDTKPPTLADIGPCDIGIWAGNVQQQTELQQLGASIDVSKQTTLSVAINATLGPNFNGYFVRVTSLALKDTATGFPYEAFSAKFALSGMSGTFDPTVQAQINGASSLGTVGGTISTSTGTSSTVSPPVITSAKSASSSGSPTSTATPATKSNAAVSTGYNVALLGAVMAFTGFML
ncbi:hypothetical protein BU17DRAFT_68732 [Hysterangium stoloniferum]|nr:hypothetical protein BU17DRAFT_68732 [Hysterangium stoloniferum]